MAVRGCGMEHDGPCLGEMTQDERDSIIPVDENALIRTVVLDVPNGPITLLTFDTATGRPRYATGMSAMRALEVGTALLMVARVRLAAHFATTEPGRQEQEMQALVTTEEYEEATGDDDEDDGPQSEFNVDRTPWRGI